MPIKEDQSDLRDPDNEDIYQYSLNDETSNNNSGKA